jgi:hypothetical protein
MNLLGVLYQKRPTAAKEWVHIDTYTSDYSSDLYRANPYSSVSSAKYDLQGYYPAEDQPVGTTATCDDQNGTYYIFEVQNV